MKVERERPEIGFADYPKMHPQSADAVATVIANAQNRARELAGTNARFDTYTENGIKVILLQGVWKYAGTEATK